MKDAADLGVGNPEAHHDGNVACLFHHHHGERYEYVERGDNDDQSKHNERDDLFKFQRSEKLAVLLHPVGSLEAGAGGLFDRMADVCGAVEVVDAEADDADEIGFRRRGFGPRRGA